MSSTKIGLIGSVDSKKMLVYFILETLMQENIPGKPLRIPQQPHKVRL